MADPDCQAPPSSAWSLQGSCSRGLRAFARIYAGWGVPREFYRQELLYDYYHIMLLFFVDLFLLFSFAVSICRV